MAGRRIPVSNGEVKQKPQAERRARVRLPRAQEVWCQLRRTFSTEEESIAWFGRVRDASPLGMGLRMSRRFEPGSELVVELSDKRNGVRLFFPVRVVHAAGRSKGHWIIGCEFLRPLSEDELHVLLQE